MHEKSGWWGAIVSWPIVVYVACVPKFVGIIQLNHESVGRHGPGPSQIPITPAEPGARLPALSFPGGFRTTAPVLVTWSEMGRHPKPFTLTLHINPSHSH